MKINGVEINDYELFILSRWVYSIGEQIIPDSHYNQLLHFMQVSFPDNEYVNRSWSSDPCPVELIKKVGKTEWIASIVLGDKTESIPSLNTWHELETTLRFIHGSGTLSMKLDGWNVQANYYNGDFVNIQSRGRSTDAVDMSKLAPKVPKRIPQKGKVRIALEATIPDCKFGEMVLLFGNVSQRSAVSTALAKCDDLSLIDLHAHSIYGVDFDPDKKFELLESWGFKTPKWHKVSNFEELKMAMESLSSMREGYGSPTDGMVYWGDFVYAIRLLAWEEPLYSSYITGYEEEFSAHRINPKLKIYPVYRKGGNQQLVNITNWQRIIDNDLKPMSPIAFKLVSESIADIDEDATRRLQIEWDGHEDIYCEQVRNNEILKAQQRQHLSYMNK